MELLSRTPYNLPFFIDINGGNFIKNDDGDEYYVDTIKMGEGIRHMNAEINTKAIMEYMREKGYDESDIAKVTNSLKRLNAIFINNNQKG